MKKQVIEVQFRKFKGELTAVFPYVIEGENTVGCYVHLGQHTTCMWDINRYSKPAKPTEYESLLNELKSIGYDPIIIKRRDHAKYMKAYKNPSVYTAQMIWVNYFLKTPSRIK